MEWNAQAVRARAVSTCASPVTTTLATTSEAHRGITLLSGPDQPGKTHLNGMSG